MSEIRYNPNFGKVEKQKSAKGKRCWKINGCLKNKAYVMNNNDLLIMKAQKEVGKDDEKSNLDL